MSDDLVMDFQESPATEPEAVEAVAPEVVEQEVTETQEATPQAEPTEELVEDAPVPKLNGSQRWKAKAAHLQEEVEMLRMRLEGTTPVPATAPLPIPGKPTLADCDYDQEAFVEAMADWKADAKIAQMKAQERAESASSSWNTKAQEARKEFPDFDEAMDNADNPSRSVADALLESPVGPKVAYYLATHPEDYSRINKLGPMATARELTLIEAKMPGSKQAPKKVTQAPKPPTPVVAASVAPTTEKGNVEFY